MNRDNFKKGSQNPWPEVFSEFSEGIKQNIGKTNHAKLMPKFSTTTELEQVIHDMSLMNAMESYFSFKCQTDCGISKVKLMGTLQDW